jgi:hypothetical protein
VKGTLDNEAVASKLVGHQWAFKTPESFEKYRNKAKDVDYDFAPKLDSDVNTTIGNLSNAEISLGGWNLAKASLMQQRSDPICSSQGCPANKYVEADKGKVIQYPFDAVLDSDVTNTLNHEAAASDEVGHVWNPPTL